jgi:hypothetical protein
MQVLPTLKDFIKKQSVLKKWTIMQSFTIFVRPDRHEMQHAA